MKARMAYIVFSYSIIALLITIAFITVFANEHLLCYPNLTKPNDAIKTNAEGHLLVAMIQHTIDIELVVPAMHVFGSNQYPNTPSQRQALEQKRSEWLEANGFFQINREASCQLTHAEVNSSLLDAWEADTDMTATPATHDVDARWSFYCHNPTQLKSIHIYLQTHFIKRVDTLRVEWVQGAQVVEQIWKQDGVLKFQE